MAVRCSSDARATRFLHDSEATTADLVGIDNRILRHTAKQYAETVPPQSCPLIAYMAR